MEKGGIEKVKVSVTITTSIELEVYCHWEHDVEWEPEGTTDSVYSVPDRDDVDEKVKEYLVGKGFDLTETEYEINEID